MTEDLSPLYRELKGEGWTGPAVAQALIDTYPNRDLDGIRRALRWREARGGLGVPAEYPPDAADA